jgi:PAS domain S-box-containing protein
MDAQADAQMETGLSADTPDIRAERCEYLYQRVRPAIYATLATSLLFSAFLLWRARPQELVVLWQGIMLALCAGLWLLGRSYSRTCPADRDPNLWIRRLAMCAAALGAGWGYAAAVFFPGGGEEQVFIAFVVAFLVAGGLSMFSTVWWVYAMYAAGVMLPFNVVLFAFGTEFFRLLGLAVPIIYVANVLTAFQLGKVFTTAFSLRGAYAQLSSSNADVQTQLGEQLDSLLEAHRAVEAYGRKLSLFSERAPIAVFEVDARATILDMNPAAENLFGYGSPELVGRSGIAMLLAADDLRRTEQWWSDFVAAGVPTTVVNEHCVRRDGLEISVEWTLTPLVDARNAVISVVLQGRDITQQRAAERVRSEFASTLSHELRTPLTSILGSLQLLRSGALGELHKDHDEVVEIAERNGKRLLDLINEVLDIEKIESGQLSIVPEMVAVDDLVRDALRLNQGFADRFSVRLRLEGEAPAVTIRADRKRLVQILTNLLSNAAKFSPPNGSVDVSVAVKHGRVRVSVGDRGPGIPADFRNRIFGRFAQANSADSRIKGGTGLGLAICKRLVQMMDGTIGFEDREGGGTSFYFEFPVASDAESADHRRRVLITEHDPVGTEYLAMILEKAGYQVDIAPDASATRALLARWKYAAWVLAARLPGVPETVAFVNEQRPNLGNTRIVMLAALRTDMATIAEPERYGISGWIMRNDPRATIEEAVNKAVAGA